LCVAGGFLVAKKATAQCSAADVLQRQLSLAKTTAPVSPMQVIQSANAVQVWKTIQVGTVSDKSALLAALNAAQCGVGNSVWNMLFRREVIISTTNVALEPIREVWIHNEWFAARRLSMMRIMARRTKAATVVA
jgi:hypothetical protein